MTETQTIPEHLIPRTWQLWYAYGNLSPQIKVFVLEGSMKEAIQRAREHCVKMNYRFLRVRPHIVDLEEQEQRREAGQNEDEDS